MEWIMTFQILSLIKNVVFNDLLDWILLKHDLYWTKLYFTSLIDQKFPFWLNQAFHNFYLTNIYFTLFLTTCTQLKGIFPRLQLNKLYLSRMFNRLKSPSPRILLNRFFSMNFTKHIIFQNFANRCFSMTYAALKSILHDLYWTKIHFFYNLYNTKVSFSITSKLCVFSVTLTGLDLKSTCTDKILLFHEFNWFKCIFFNFTVLDAIFLFSFLDSHTLFKDF